MITEKDIQTLKSYDTPLGKIADWAVVLAPLFLVMLCIFNLYMASRIGMSAGYDFIALLKNWAKSVNTNQLYAGIFLLALKRLEAAILQLCFAIIFAILAYAYHKRKKMDQRILETLMQNGLL